MNALVLLKKTNKPYFFSMDTLKLSRCCYFRIRGIPKEQVNLMFIELYKNVQILRNSDLIAKLAFADMHSDNAIYHASCHKTLRNEASVCEKNKQAGINVKEQCLEYLNQYAESIALSEVVIEIEGEGNFTDKIFALAYLFKMYQERVKLLVNGDAS